MIKKKNELVLALIHSETSPKKREYNRQYYQTHKDYWKNYYKTGHGIGRGGTEHVTEEREAKKRANEAYNRAELAYSKALARYYKTKPGTGYWATQKDGTTKWIDLKAQALEEAQAAKRKMDIYKEGVDLYDGMTWTGGPWTHPHSGGGGKW